MSGIFISFEGIDGSGKSTQLERCCDWFAARGIEPVRVREPGGTPLGERVRELLLDPTTGDMAPAAEALLYAASRAELVSSVIEPALRAGRVVIADRFVDSSIAYQGAGRGLGADRVLAANELALGSSWPHLTIFVRLSPEQAQARLAAARVAAGNAPDRLEAAGLAFFQLVADEYDGLAARHPDRIMVIDGERPADEVELDVIAALTTTLELDTQVTR